MQGGEENSKVGEGYMRSLPANTFLPICLMTSENTERWSLTVATSLRERHTSKIKTLNPYLARDAAAVAGVFVAGALYSSLHIFRRGGF